MEVSQSQPLISNDAIELRHEGDLRQGGLVPKAAGLLHRAERFPVIGRLGDRMRDQLAYAVALVGQKVVSAPAVTLHQLHFEHDHLSRDRPIYGRQYV